MKLPRASTVVATVFGIGYFDVAPGTIMSAIAVPLAILIGLYGGGGMGILASSIIVLVIGILACAEHVRETDREDPSECVIDELAGQWLACAFCMLTLGGLLPVATISKEEMADVLQNAREAARAAAAVIAEAPKPDKNLRARWL